MLTSPASAPPCAVCGADARPEAESRFHERAGLAAAGMERPQRPPCRALQGT
jgi:hypothetical protein